MNVLEIHENEGFTITKVGSSSKRGVEYSSACPECGGDDRFRIWPEQNSESGSFWCRGCDKGGDIIEYLKVFQKKTYHEACEIIGREVPPGSMDLKLPRQKREWVPVKVEDPAELWQEKAEKFLNTCKEQLKIKHNVIKYLAKRGITEDLIEKFELGWNEKDEHRPRKSWGLTGDKKKKIWIPAGLVIPYRLSGKLLRLRIRVNTKVEREWIKKVQKYYVVPGSTMSPFLIKPEHKAHVIVETELDGIMLSKIADGIELGVIAIGNTTTRPDLESYEFLKDSAHILLAQDYDGSPGAKSSQWWLERFYQAVRWPVPEGKDPGEAFEKGVDMKSWLLAGLPPAWNLSLSDLESDERGNGKIEEDRSLWGELVNELYELISKTKIGLVCSENQTSILDPEKRCSDYEDLSKRVSEIVFSGDELTDYFLYNHRNEVIKKDTFWLGAPNE